MYYTTSCSAIAATIKKNRFTEEDRTAALVNYILGSTHITEGAIPFAAKNPLKVIPILMISSSVSAVATYLMKVQVPAPHGGFLILGLVNKPLVWVVCILLGSIAGAFLYIMVTPPVKETVSLSPLFKVETVSLSLEQTEKEAVIDEMIQMLKADGVLNNAEAFKAEIMKREEFSSTSFGTGIAIPHGKSWAVNIPRVAVGLSKKGIAYDATDKVPVSAVFMIAVGEGEGNTHLSLLSDLSQKLMEPAFMKCLNECSTKEEIVALLEKE